MALFGSGTAGKYWKLGGLGLKPLSIGPLSLLGWYSGGANGFVAGFGNALAGTGSAWYPFFLPGTAFRAPINDGVAAVYGPNAGNPPANVWVMMLAVLPAPGTEIVYYGRSGGDAASVTSSGTFTADPVWDEFNIGAAVNTATPNNCLMAEAALWNRALGLADAKQLLLGANPLTLRGPPPVLYFPLRNDFGGRGQMRAGLAGVGAPTVKWGPHPPVALPPSRRALAPAGAPPPPADPQPPRALVLA